MITVVIYGSINNSILFNNKFTILINNNVVIIITEITTNITNNTLQPECNLMSTSDKYDDTATYTAQPELREHFYVYVWTVVLPA